MCTYVYACVCTDGVCPWICHARKLLISWHLWYPLVDGLHLCHGQWWEFWVNFLNSKLAFTVLFDVAGPGTIFGKLQRVGQVKSFTLHGRPLPTITCWVITNGTVICDDDLQYCNVSGDPQETAGCSSQVMMLYVIIWDNYFAAALWAKTPLCCENGRFGKLMGIAHLRRNDGQFICDQQIYKKKQPSLQAWSYTCI